MFWRIFELNSVIEKLPRVLTILPSSAISKTFTVNLSNMYYLKIQ